MSTGVLYATTGEQQRRYAQQSAARVRELTDFPIHVITDEFVSEKWPTDTTFKKIDEPTYSLGDKVAALNDYVSDPKCNRTLYLDGDTYICDETALQELFSVLDSAALAVCLDVVRGSQFHDHQYAESVNTPAAFPMPNTGVMAFRSTNVADLINEWAEIYQEHQRHQQENEWRVNDQPAFEQALASSNVRWVALPSVYNYRPNSPNAFYGPVKILHVAAENLTDLAADSEFDENAGRVTWPVSLGDYRDDQLRVIHAPVRIQKRWEQFKLAVEVHGILKATQLTVGHLLKKVFKR